MAVHVARRVAAKLDRERVLVPLHQLLLNLRRHRFVGLFRRFHRHFALQGRTVERRLGLPGRHAGTRRRRRRLLQHGHALAQMVGHLGRLLRAPPVFGFDRRVVTGGGDVGDRDEPGLRHRKVRGVARGDGAAVLGRVVFFRRHPALLGDRHVARRTFQGRLLLLVVHIAQRHRGFLAVVQSIQP